MCKSELCLKAEGLGRIPTLASMSMVPGCELLVAARACLSTDSRGVVPSSLVVSLKPAARAPPTRTCRKHQPSLTVAQYDKARQTTPSRDQQDCVSFCKDCAALYRSFWQHTLCVYRLPERQAPAIVSSGKRNIVVQAPARI